MDLVNAAKAIISGEPSTYDQISDFKKAHSYSARLREARKVKIKYPSRVPIICEVSPSSKHEISLDKAKYLVPMDLTIGQFIYVIRKRIRMQSHQALFIFINNTIPATGTMISQLYREHADEDQFLYTSISLESTFGAEES